MPFRVFMKKRKGYIYTNKRNSNRAVMAVILGIISLVSLVTVVCLTYASGGEASTGYGFTGLFATLFSAVGLVLGILTVKNKDYYVFFPVLGIILNFAALGGVSLILYAGANFE